MIGADAARTALLVYPYYPDNPWQDIVYREFIAAGGTVIVLDDLSGLAPAADAVRDDGRTAVLHMNWTTPISQATADVVDSMDRVQAALDHIDRFLASGGRMAWSIHNALPHETNHLLPEIILCRGLAARADRIVIMNPATLDSVAHLYPIAPDKCLQVDFPSYIGVYPDDADRTEARRRFGMEEDDIVCVFVGVLRPYKGLEPLLAAFDFLAASDSRYRLMIGGKPGPGYSEQDLARIFHERPYLHFHGGHVPDDVLQWWMAAADLVVLPYVRGLNISVVQLAATFGRPVALRRRADLTYLEPESWIRWIDGEGRELADSIERAADALRAEPDASARARSYATLRSPERISAAYRDLFAQLAAS